MENIKINAKKYNQIKISLSVFKGVLSWILILFFVLTGLSSDLLSAVSEFIDNKYFQFLLFSVLSGGALSLLFLPLNFYSEYILEHKYNLSNQTVTKWIIENLKGLLVGGIIGIPILFFFFYSLQTFENLWWLPFAIGMFIISVVLAKILPVIILPLFYKILPLEDEDLIKRIGKLSEGLNLKIENVFKFDMSKNTKKANAAFTGLGKTKKIILGDTLLENFSNDEIEVVLAHEFGHFKHKHIIKNIVLSTVSSFLIFFLMAFLYKNSLGWFGFDTITQIDALPILSLWAVLIGVFQSPITNWISRKFEYEADHYAVSETDKHEVFKSALLKLNEQNLGDPDPHPLVEWYSYSHPSIKRRLAYIDDLKNKI